MKPDYDVLVIGSGFGGSVSALRLTEKGYRVGVLEAGQRFTDADFAKTSWDLRKFLWAPQLGMYGIQRIHLLRNVMILAGAGVGGGSLNYANTLYVPPDPFFNDPQWKDITDWRAELMPHYDQAQRMLGVVKNPTFTDADRIVKEVADDMGCGDTFVSTPVGVFFGLDGEMTPGKTVPDPFFGGVGPARTGCIECGECMTGCRHGAKNTLVKNYLGLAESAGAQVHPMTTVTSFEQRADGLWEVTTVRTGSKLRRHRKTFTATHLILAAGTYNTQKLLFKMRDSGKLAKLSSRLGVLTRTNSESIVGAQTLTVTPGMDLTHGVAITSSVHPTSDTHVEPVRYGKGSNAMGLLQTLMTDGAGPQGTDVPRWRQFLDQAREDPAKLVRLLNPQRWSERTVIALVMQHLDNSITTFTKRGPGGRRVMTSKQGHGEPNPTWIPVGNEFTRRMAEKVDGVAGGTWGELFNIPLTAHFLGGAAIGDSAEHGVIDPYQRVYNYPTLYVMDGAAISANLGVNPSLSITAQAERAASLWPNKGQEDQRPGQNEPYRKLAPIAPEHPVVPADAPAGLRRLPIEPVNTSG
ncbi:GMC family oxidoreductase [Mycolicibacterium fortuitum]|uniref:Cholesterol oxidase n=1 Tax=Mycolicibacterium fortuitum subsp. fortuitum DSM 46621 = ATCC 6841 = JCM 6387 TaxID=1214102 RepID=K0VNS5_MYCFO|nr:GMC family oxidoreductase [Mycolicibacterium fortuitum]AIY45550.1 Cholesterol oxidase [Mycobacterium sp. VKM Ac-1817D]AMD54315.1 cholesterol oxidase [Mycolicibacterium fortuitum subsp. fortuitum DSM 46621 = ATCC 6841 = JCM 6387]EJZ12859.1 FAD dependent oxidoreductase [Mycolicibacterium fortuitum subsp. fortuitum DSM 46621 = ATCC 6841 = JCM 6387]OBK71492.1 cholesterol oxidase [Mycolicibacterium fortuitum]WBG54453.1 cholesterol oxidase [Mycolicibacterium fortuitum]